MQREDIKRVIEALWPYVMTDWQLVIDDVIKRGIDLIEPTENTPSSTDRLQMSLVLLVERRLQTIKLDEQLNIRDNEVNLTFDDDDDQPEPPPLFTGVQVTFEDAPDLEAPEDPAQFPDYRVHEIQTIECYTSNSGNVTWKAIDIEGYIIYLRQSQRDQLTAAGLWDKLQTVPLGESWEVSDARIHTTEDGDFRKPEMFDGKWEFHQPKPRTPDNQKQVIHQAQKWLQSDFVVLDTETTGLDDAYPVEVTVIDQNGKVLFDERIKPPEGIEIEAGATKVHGIEAEALKDCRTWEQAFPEFFAAVMDKTILIYNAEYDTSVIERANGFYKIKDFKWNPDCVMLAYAEYNGDWNSYHQSYRWVKLTDACEKEGLRVAAAHSALGDCLMTLELVKTLAAKPIKESGDIPF